MGVTTEQWRATIGRWSGGKPGKCVIIGNSVARKPDTDSYRWFRHFVLVLLLVIGCVELNPGPNRAKETSAPSLSDGALPKFSRRPGSVGLHGELYGIRMASFLFARGLNNTEEFQLASNINGAAGAFDDVVFKYKLKEQEVCKTCFIQLKHKKNEYTTIKRSSLTQLSGDFSLFKYFESYCQIKEKASVDSNLKLCGLFVDFEFIIYTNARLKSYCVAEEVDINPVSILSSGPNQGEHITFDEKFDEDIFDFFKELSRYYNFLLELVNPVNVGACADKEIKEKLRNINSTFTNTEIRKKLNNLKSEPSNDAVRKMIKELEKCDFSLYTEFLQKVKIFQCQSNVSSFETSIKKELQDACHTSCTGTDSIYKKFEDGVRQWWEKSGSVKWLSESSHVWQNLKECWIEKIKEVSEIDVQESLAYGIYFNEQHIQAFCHFLKRKTLLNVITNTNCGTLSKLKIYQALNSLGYGNSLFIGLKSLMNRREEIIKLWPCKWSSVLVVHCEQGSDTVDNNLADILMDMSRDSRKKLILISQREHQHLASRLQQKLGNIYSDYEDDCSLLDLDEKSQELVLKKTVDFQGTEVSLEELVGKDPPQIIKEEIKSNVLSLLLSRKQKLCIGRKLSDPCSYYVPRMLEHRVYVNGDILYQRDNTLTFAITGIQLSQLKKYLPFGEKIHKFEFDETSRNIRFNTIDSFTEPGFGVESVCERSNHNVPQSSNTKEVRYVILENKHPEYYFNNLKKYCENVHWIHMENGSFVWKDSNCGIDVIRRYISNIECESYDVKRVIQEQKYTTMLLAAEPGMGKSTFLSCLEHEINKSKPSMWVLRINLHDRTHTLKNIEFEGECIETCEEFLWNAAHSSEQNALALEKIIFLEALKQEGNAVVILDGFDEICPDYSIKVEMLIREIRKKVASKIWVSSRSSYRIKLENIMMKFAFTLRPFTKQNQITCLEQYWNKAITNPNQESLRNFAKELLRLFSKNFSEKNGQFTNIPLQTMMLGEAFVKEAENYCLSREVNLPKNFNLPVLFRKFVEKKCDIYFKEKNEMDCSKPLANRNINICVEGHINLALEYLLSLDRLNQLLGVECTSYKKRTEEFLKSGDAYRFGIITESTDGKPRFIHRCFAEYFAAKWFTKNFSKCQSFILDNLFEPSFEVIRNIFDRMLAEEFKLHDAVLNNDLEAVSKLLKEETDVNILDNGGRTALHLAASYNSRTTKALLSVQGVDTKITDGVLKWTPLEYAGRTRSWMAMDSLLQSGGNADYIVLTRSTMYNWKWEEAALCASAEQGYKNLLESMLNSGNNINGLIFNDDIPECQTVIQIALLYNQEDVVRFLIERGADIYILGHNDNTPVHFAARMNSGSIINLLLDKGMPVNMRNNHDRTPLHEAVYWCNLRGTEVLVKRGAALDKTDDTGRSPLMWAAARGKLEVVRYLVENGADINVCNATESALHLAIGRGLFDMTCFLLEKGADINGSNVKRGMNPLHLAIRYIKIAKYLIQRGADVNLCTRDGTNMTALHVAAHSDFGENFEFLIDAGAKLNEQDWIGFTPLHWAVANNNTALVLLLLEKGADVNITDFKRRTPLYLSVLNNNIMCAIHCVNFGADINYKGAENITALSKAKELGRKIMARILVLNCAHINFRDDSGDTATHVAVGEGDPSLIHYLRDREADINIPNNERDTPLQCNILHQLNHKADHELPDELRPVIDKTLRAELAMNLRRLRQNRDSIVRRTEKIKFSCS